MYVFSSVYFVIHDLLCVEQVSSFSTSGKLFGRKSNYGIRKPAGCSELDFIRWRNCLRRDFTINGLRPWPFELET